MTQLLALCFGLLDAVAAMGLGPVQRLVGTCQQRVQAGGRDIGVAAGQADTHGDLQALVGLHHVQVLYGTAQAFGGELGTFRRKPGG